MFDPWMRKIPWRKAQQPTSVFLPGELHGQSSLVGHSPWGHKEIDTTEHTHTYMNKYWFLNLLHRIPIFSKIMYFSL